MTIKIDRETFGLGDRGHGILNFSDKGHDHFLNTTMDSMEDLYSFMELSNKV